MGTALRGISPLDLQGENNSHRHGLGTCGKELSHTLIREINYFISLSHSY